MSEKDINRGMSSPDSRPRSPHELSIKDNVTIGGRAETLGRVPKVSKVLSFHSFNGSDVIHSTPSKKPKLPTVTFLSPIKSPIPRQQAPYLTAPKGKLVSQPSHQRANRSPTLSEDSFARGDTQLEEEQYLATSKKFTTPLADLAHSDDDELLTQNTGAINSSQIVVCDGKDECLPIVLVPSTPSQSECSDYYKDENRWKFPQNENDLEGQNPSRMALDSESGKGAQYSQGFDGQEEAAEVEGLYTSMCIKRLLPVQEDTSQETQLATQIATHEEAFVPETPSTIPQTNTSTYTHISTRSLLSHMDPNKRARYQHLIQSTPASPISLVTRQFPARGLEMAVHGVEIQSPSVPEPRVPSLTPVQVLSPRKSSPKKPASHQISTPSSVNTMDIVPDSEPLQEQLQSSVLEKPLLKVDGAGLRTRTGGSGVKRLSNDSDVTEDSDVLSMPKKFSRREEEERGEEEEEEGEELLNDTGGRETGGSEHDSDWVVKDNDDDKPLFSHLHKDERNPTFTYASKSKVSFISMALPYSSLHLSPITEIKQSARQQKRQQGSETSKINLGDTSHESAVPSSVPDQDHSLVRFRKPSFKAAATAKEKENQRRTCRATSVPRSSRSACSTAVEADDDRDLDMEAVRESERAAEIVMDEASEEEHMEPGATRHNLKRKRGRPPKSKSMNQTLMTPQTRSTKRLKSAGSTISKAGATRVFALWKQNKLWYSGIIYEHISANAYMVKFDDGSETIVNTEHMRTNDLRIGDLVRFGKGNKDFQVTKVNYRSNMATIEGGPDDLEFKEIGISTKVINSTWQDRLVNPRSVVAAVRDIDVRVKSTPSPSRSAASFHSLNTNANAKGPRQSYKFLQKAGLIVTLGSNTNDRTEDGKSRSDILRAVRDSGGVVVDDLFKYLKMDILFSTHRWIIERDSVQWVGEPKELQRLFLIADNYNLKPKYLMALALGIPCLSIKWLYACLEAVSVAPS